MLGKSTTFTKSVTMLELPFMNFICSKCACPFSFPEAIWEVKKNKERAIHCPNGHKIYPIPAPKIPRSDILAAHEAEQREAREADMARRDAKRAKKNKANS